MINLNSQQKKAVEHEEGPCLVASVPGSGKTAVLVERTARLIEKGVTPSSILSVTFTNKASKEMRKRVTSRLGTSKVDCVISTFHSFCVKVLRNYGSNIGYGSNFSILGDSDQKALISQIGKKLGIPKKKINAYSILSKVNISRENLEELSFLQQDSITIQHHGL